VPLLSVYAVLISQGTDEEQQAERTHPGLQESAPVQDMNKRNYVDETSRTGGTVISEVQIDVHAASRHRIAAAFTTPASGGAQTFQEHDTPIINILMFDRVVVKELS
jgi:hypothetical protein